MRRSFLIAILVGAPVAAAIACTTPAAKDEKICTKGSFVFCRCEDQQKGTHKCLDDEKSFDECKCGTENPQPVFTGDAGFVEVDSGPVDPEAPKIANDCAQKIAVIAGVDGPPPGSSDVPSPAQRTTWGAGYQGDGVFKVTKSESGPGVRTRPVIAPRGVGASAKLFALWRGQFDSLVFSEYAAGSWTSPESQTTTSDRPSFASIGDRVDVGFRYFDQTNREMFYGNDGWETDNGEFFEGRTIHTSDAGVAPALAAVQTAAYAAYISDTRSLVVEQHPWTAAPVQVVAKDKVRPTTTPVMTGLEASAKDLLLVFVTPELQVQYSVRTSGDKKWSTPKAINPNANTTDKDVPAIAQLSAGRAAVAWRAPNKHGFVSIYDSTADTWSNPVDVVNNVDGNLLTAPSIAQARCGGADVIVGYVLQDGSVAIDRFGDGKSQGPYPIKGITNVTFAGVGEAP